MLKWIFTWKETSFEEAKKESADNKAGVASSKAHAHCHDTFTPMSAVDGPNARLHSPQHTMLELSHIEGLVFLMRMLLGISNKM